MLDQICLQQKQIKKRRVDASDFANRTDLTNVKSDVDKLQNIPSNLSNFKNKVGKLDIDKLASTPVDLSTLRDVLKNDGVKKDVYDAKKH